MAERVKKQALLWHSNAPFANTGYAQQTGLFLPRLKEHFELACSCFYGLEGNVIPWNGIPLLPGFGGTFGNEMIEAHAKGFFGDDPNGLIVTLCDVWALDASLWSQFNLASWVPVDHEPAPPLVRDFFERSGSIPIAMSKFGQEQLADYDPLYVPHAVDTKVYKPHNKAKVRESTGMPKDAFIVGMVAANKGVPSRKCFPQALQAFKRLHDRHSDAMLYLHSAVYNGAGLDHDAVNLPVLIDACGIPREAVLFADQDRVLRYPFKPEQMARIYSAFDVLLSPSAGEGFGLCVLEANACGVPAIVTDFSAQPEVNGAGWCVEYRKVWTQQRSWQADPDIADIAEALNHCYSLPEAGRKAHSKQARKHALTYDIERVMAEHMLPALKTVAERISEGGEIKVKAA